MFFYIAEGLTVRCGFFAAALQTSLGSGVKVKDVPLLLLCLFFFPLLCFCIVKLPEPVEPPSFKREFLFCVFYFSCNIKSCNHN